VGILVLDFHFPMAAAAGAAGMWESQLRFPRAVGSVENPLLVFLAVHGPSFPQLLLSRDFPSPDAREQLPLGFLHGGRCLRVIFCFGQTVELFNRSVSLQKSA
jgi:hypothetical protein